MPRNIDAAVDVPDKDTSASLDIAIYEGAEKEVKEGKTKRCDEEAGG